MNILYVSNITFNPVVGFTYSIPAQIEAQAHYDNIFWYNLNYIDLCKSNKEVKYNNLNKYSSGSINELPIPFNKPDLIIFEGFYCFGIKRIVLEVLFKNVPYIIVPRSNLTFQGQKKKTLKKKISNMLFFRLFAKKALAIHYLSKQEFFDSGIVWNKNYFIIPNGITLNTDLKKEYSINVGINAVYIGRYDIYQKGLDILFEAINSIQAELRKRNFKIVLYGSANSNSVISELNDSINKYEIKDLVTINDAVYGDDKREILKKNDVFIMTSRFEGMPMGMLEALSLGLPCLATTGTNMSDEIEKANAGWACMGDSKSVSKALLRIIDEKQQLEQKSFNAYSLAKKYSWNEIAKLSHKQYKNILCKKGNKFLIQNLK